MYVYVFIVYTLLSMRRYIFTRLNYANPRSLAGFGSIVAFSFMKTHSSGTGERSSNETVCCLCLDKNENYNPRDCP
jgi:hypothetical protein